MIAALLFTLCWIAGAGAGTTEGGEASATPAPTLVIHELGLVNVEAGTSSSFTIRVSVADGHRVQANPASSEFLVPLEVRFADLEHISFEAPIYPPGVPYRLEGTDEDLSTYVDEFEITVGMTIADNAKAGRRLIGGEVSYQACNSRVCLFPSSLGLTLEVVVTEDD
jgi:hypothetical protein